MWAILAIKHAIFNISVLTQEHQLLKLRTTYEKTNQIHNIQKSKAYVGRLKQPNAF